MSEADKTPMVDVSKIDSPEALASFEGRELPIKNETELADKFVPEQERVLDHDTQDLLDLLDDVEIPPDKTPAIKIINDQARAIQEKAKAKAQEELKGQSEKKASPSEAVETPAKKEVIGLDFKETRESQEPEKLAQEFSEATRNFFDQQMAWLNQQIETASSPERKQALNEWKERLERNQEIVTQLETAERKPERDKAIREGTLNEVKRLGVGDQTGAFKPAAGENINMSDTYGFERYQAYRREWVASRINDAFGLDVVPPTAVRNTETGIGSLQQWQNAEQDTTKRWETHEGPKRDQDLEEISVLHFITDQADGHYGNVMLDENGRMKSFDNGISFGSFDSISHAEALMRNGLNIEQASKAVMHIYKKSENRPELKSAPMIELLEGRADSYPINENLQENIKAFLADPKLQSGLHECFDAAFGDESGDKFGKLLNKLYELSDKGLPPYKYPGKRRK